MSSYVAITGRPTGDSICIFGLTPQEVRYLQVKSELVYHVMTFNYLITFQRLVPTKRTYNLSTLYSRANSPTGSLDPMDGIRLMEYDWNVLALLYSTP